LKEEHECQICDKKLVRKIPELKSLSGVISVLCNEELLELCESRSVVGSEMGKVSVGWTCSSDGENTKCRILVSKLSGEGLHVGKLKTSCKTTLG